MSVPFFDKLDRTVEKSESQMLARAGGGAERIVFFIPNFDDLLSEYKADYLGQIDDHLGSTYRARANLVFYNQRTAFHRILSMRHAEVVNEGS